MVYIFYREVSLVKVLIDLDTISCENVCDNEMEIYVTFLCM